MRHKDEGAGPGVEQVLKDGKHIGVHVVARLVENEDVGLAQKHEHELQAALLATGELLHARELLTGLEADIFKQLRRRVLLAVDCVTILEARKHLAHRLTGMGKELVKALGEHRALHGLADLHRARGRSEAAGENGEQRRLARPVGAEDAVAVTRANKPVHVVEDLLVPKVHRDVLELEDLLAQAAHSQAVQLDGVTHRRHVVDQLMGRLGAELGLARPGLRAASQPCKLLAQQVLPAVLNGARLTVALETLLDVGGVAALEGVHDTVVHLPHG